MKITSLSAQLRTPERVNVAVDGRYRFSLDIFQVTELGIKVGNDYSEAELVVFEEESQFGKLYARALEYCLMRPHSAKELHDYLRRKMRPTRRLVKPSKQRQAAGEYRSRVVEKPGVSEKVAERVFERLEAKGYINDEAFTRFWVDNRHLTKGASQRKLRAELQAKGVDRTIIDAALEASDRSEETELMKQLAKKYAKYDDKQKLIAYLARQGFYYGAITEAIRRYEDDDS